MKTQTLDAIPAEAKRVAIAVIAGLIAPILDTTIVTIGFDNLTTAMSAPVGTVQWTNTGYLLALAVAVPLAGWSALRFGSRAVWRTGLSAFFLGSILCAAAWNIQALIAFRVLQGLGAGLLFPLMTSVLVAASGAPRARSPRSPGQCADGARHRSSDRSSAASSCTGSTGAGCSSSTSRVPDRAALSAGSRRRSPGGRAGLART
ncbi:MFS transporter, partial [Gordonia spumicola]|uniref:MFS transporter n=1 Tax=Gordonia spumicola TaxID=589161 RepID=UPI001E5D88F6